LGGAEVNATQRSFAVDETCIVPESGPLSTYFLQTNIKKVITIKIVYQKKKLI
jgi:hypothetical protein